MTVRRWAFAWGIVLATSLGCASEDDRPATFTYVFSTVIQPSCTTIGCHNTFVATYGFRLDSRSGAYALLTGKVCDEDAPDIEEEPPGNFVRPGQPDRSKLVQLLKGDNVPRRMPPDVPLPEKDIELVERWILEGAACD